MLEVRVGLYGLVRNTGTSSLTGFKPYHHFFLMTVIHRNSFVFTKRVFWSQNITYAFAYSVHEPHSWLGRSSVRGAMKGEGNRSMPVLLFPSLSPAWLGLWFGGGCSRGYVRGTRVVLDSHRQLSVVN